jgi:integrase
VVGLHTRWSKGWKINLRGALCPRGYRIRSRASRDLSLAQRFARHVSPLTTVVYTHVSDEELSERIRRLRC